MRHIAHNIRCGRIEEAGQLHTRNLRMDTAHLLFLRNRGAKSTKKTTILLLVRDGDTSTAPTAEQFD